jgi:hypothetical protein
LTISVERETPRISSRIRLRPPNELADRRWVWPAAVTAAGLVLFVAYLRQAQITPLRSDGGSIALQAWDMFHGNPLLRGWTLSDVSFYTTEIPQYALIEMVRGLNAGVVDWAAAMTYTLLVIGAALLAKGNAWGLEGAVRALVATGIMLAPSAGGTLTLLSDPDHTGTQVALVGIWLVLDRCRQRWWAPVAVSVLLTWAQVADPMALYEGALPIMLVCGFRVYRHRNERSDLPLAIGAVISGGIARVLLHLIGEAGGFVVQSPYAMFTQVSSLYSHVWVTAESILVLYGADFSGQRLAASAAITLVHLAGVFAAGWAVARVARQFGTCELLVQVLAVAMLVVVLAYTFNGQMNVGSNHEIVGALPVGAVLAGRVLAGPLIRGRYLPVLALILACYAGGLLHHADQPPAADPDKVVAAWLSEHQLSYGFASYWTASAVTVDSGDAVRVRPVSRTGRRLSVAPWESSAAWYQRTAGDARFVIISRHSGLCWRVTVGEWRNSAGRTFGPPAAAYHVGGFLILVWDRNILLSGHLKTLAATSPAVC